MTAVERGTDRRLRRGSPAAIRAGDGGGEPLPPLIMHVIHRLAVGGLENGLVNLVNHLPEHRYRHAIVCLTDYTDFRGRIRRTDAPIMALQKRGGYDVSTYARFFRLVRTLRPAIVHTRNLAALEYGIVAALAGCPARIHGEHGRDIWDLDGQSFKYNLLRRAVRPLIHHYIAPSQDLAGWLRQTVGVPGNRVTQIYNGVDVTRFHPRRDPRPPIGPPGFAGPETLLVGTVGRMEPVKDPVTLARAFVEVTASSPDARRRLRLVMIGEGSLRRDAQTVLREGGVEALAWLPGERADIPELIRTLDLFVLPSLREGVSNTILEAMASGLPVVATRVGGTPELVEEDQTGSLVPSADPRRLAQAIRAYLDDPARAARHGRAGRRAAEQRFGLEGMVGGYLAVYDMIRGGYQRREGHTSGGGDEKRSVIRFPTDSHAGSVRDE